MTMHETPEELCIYNDYTKYLVWYFVINLYKYRIIESYMRNEIVCFLIIKSGTRSLL